MTSMKKWWGKKSKSKDKVGGTQGHPGDDDDLQLPPTLNRNSDRNLSISRSGRHKMRKTQRQSVTNQEMYSPEAKSDRDPPQWPPLQENNAKPTVNTTASSNVTSNAPTASRTTSSSTTVQSKHSTPATANTSASGTTYHCRESVDTAKKLSGSQRGMTHAPTGAVTAV